MRRPSLKFMVLCIVFVALLSPQKVLCQVKATGGALQQEFASPMILELPADDLLESETWTRNLRDYVCDNVSIQMFQIRQVSKGRGEIKLTYSIQTKTRPSHDKMAIVKIRIMNDSERLPIFRHGRTGTGHTMRINAEEKKTRFETAEVTAKEEDLIRVLSGENPRVMIEMAVSDD